MTNSSMNNQLHIFFWTSLIISWGKLCKVKLLGQKKWRSEQSINRWYFGQKSNSVSYNCLGANCVWFFCNPMDCGPPGTVHGISQAWILEWVAVSFSRESSWPRDWTQVSCIAGRCFTLWATREALIVREVVDKWRGGRKYMGIVHFPLNFAVRLKSF